MGCGQKAWAEELEEKAHKNTQARFRLNEEYKVIDAIERTVDDLQRFLASDPSLTRVQWARIDASLSRLKDLI